MVEVGDVAGEEVDMETTKGVIKGSTTKGTIKKIIKVLICHRIER